MAVHEVEAQAPVWLNEHLPSRRGLALVLHGGNLSATETAHLENCATCNEWLQTFTGLARKAGFPIGFRIPACSARSDRNSAAGRVFHAQSSRLESLT